MKIQLPSRKALLSIAAALSGAFILAACGGGGGGGGGGGADPNPPNGANSVPLSGVVADGLIKGAQVCYDINDNGRCDSGEPVSANTGNDGAYTLSVPASEAGKHAIIAVVPVGAVDMDLGTVTVAFDLKAPPNTNTAAPIFVSPITTIVQEVMVASGTTDPAAAIQLVKEQLGMNISPLDNFIELRATNSAEAARVGSIAQVITALKQEVGSTAATAGVNETQTQALLSVVVVNNLPALAEAVASQSSSQSATQTAATIAANQGITSATVATQAQIATSIVSATTDTHTVTTPTPFVTLRDFRYTSLTNWNYRVFTGDDQTRPDGFKRANDVQVNSSAFPYARNRSYYDAATSRWYECPSDGFEAIVYKDATATTAGESTFCRTYRDSNRRSVEDISGQTISAVVSRIRASGLEGYSTWAGDPSLMQSQTAVFPAGSQLRYNINTRLSTPISQHMLEKVRVFKNTNATAFEQWPFAATLDEMIQFYSGDFNTPFVVPGNGGGASTDSMGQFPDGSYQVAGMQAVKNYRVAYQAVTATSGNARIYLCRRNATPNTNTNCAVGSSTLMNTTYTIQTLGDARVLQFANLPPELLALRKNSRLYVERGGAVFQGFKDILSTDTTVRMNNTAWTALRSQFNGVTPHTDPLAPVPAESGTWVRDMRRGTAGNGSPTFSLRAWNFAVNSSQTGGTSTEVRLNFVGDELQPFARNTMYLMGGTWRSADGPDNQCPSNGVDVDLFTLNPRGSIFCGFSVGTASSFDVDLTGRSITSTLAEMRLYGNFDFGRDYSAYGPLPVPSDPEYAAFVSASFPTGSKLRYQGGMVTSSALQLFTASQVLNGTVSFADLTAMRASFVGNYSGGTANGGTTLGIYTYQSNGTVAAGTTGQKRLRVAFDPAVGSNAARWYLCDQSSSTFGTTACVATHDTTWSVTSEGGKNVLRFASAPLGMDAQRNSRTLFIEHASSVYFGNEDVLNNKSYSQRLNKEAINAIFRILSGDGNFDISTKSTCTSAPCTP